VRLVLEDGSEYARAGKLLFSDLTVDATTGQITLRAEVPNPGALLLPGLYVRVRLEQAQASNAMTLAQQAVTRSPQGDSVMVDGFQKLRGAAPVKAVPWQAPGSKPLEAPGKTAAPAAPASASAAASAAR
jgi:membrane fusion protein (multidrug efflux system)